MKWLTTYSLKTWLILALLVVASVVRLYNLTGTLQFQGDQGRDALIVAKIFTENDLVFIGPVTSVGNMYLGPLYYYFMLPFLWATYPSPMGPVYAVAVLGIITVWLMYKLGREMVGDSAALMATFFFALSHIVVQYTRFSWNPNPAPLVTLIMMWCTHRAWTKNPWYWVGVSLCFSILAQLHYITLLAGAGAGLIWLWQAGQLATKKTEPTQKTTWQTQGVATVVSVAIFLISLTPLMLFDYKHDWLNAQAFGKLFSQEQSFKVVNHQPFTVKVAQTVKETHGRALHVLFEFPLGKKGLLQRNIYSLLTLVVFSSLTMILLKKRDPHWTGQMVVVCYLITGLIGTAFYEHTIFDHYIAYLFPVTFLVYGLVLNWWRQWRLGWLVVAAFTLWYLSFNLPRLPLLSAGWTITDMKRVSDSIASHLKPGETYNIVLLSESHDLYGQNYRYFLSTTDKKPLPPEQSSQADTLVIINEEGVTNPINTQIYEIGTFPVKTPSEVYRVDNGPEILILRK